MTQERTITIEDFLMDWQIKRAASCKSAREIAETVITPSILLINEKLGQENDPLYLAYCCEHTFLQTGVWK